MVAGGWGQREVEGGVGGTKDTGCAFVGQRGTQGLSSARQPESWLCLYKQPITQRGFGWARGGKRAGLCLPCPQPACLHGNNQLLLDSVLLFSSTNSFYTTLANKS